MNGNVQGWFIHRLRPLFQHELYRYECCQAIMRTLSSECPFFKKQQHITQAHNKQV